TERGREHESVPLRATLQAKHERSPASIRGSPTHRRGGDVASRSRVVDPGNRQGGGLSKGESLHEHLPTHHGCNAECVPKSATREMTDDGLLETAMSTVGEQLVHVLRQAGVTRVYGVVGDSLNPVVDAIRRTEGIEWIHVRNEEAGAVAAAAEPHLTGRLAVCAGSCGPGNTHL